MKNSKENLIKWISELPDDIQVYQTEINNYDCVDIKIFVKPKDREFLNWYFAP